MKEINSRLVAEALLLRLKGYYTELLEKENPSEAEKRHLISVRAGAICLEDRIKARKAKLVNSRF